MSRYCHLTLISLLLLCGSADAADDVNLIGVTGSKALLVINGGKPHWLAVGATSTEGVKLVNVNGDSVTIESGGKRETVSMGQNSLLAGATAAGGNQSATLTADHGGQFFADGAINGVAVRFLIDTGASFVSMNTGDAKRLGIDYLSGQKTMMTTANGRALAYKVKLDEVRVGEITINNVEGMVHAGDGLPIMLLGMSFLNRMEMQRDGETMVLTKRF
jgi:aspartyl protease family protein